MNSRKDREIEKKIDPIGTKRGRICWATKITIIKYGCMKYEQVDINKIENCV